MKYQNIKEEELKIRVGEDFFSDFEVHRKEGNIDFWVDPRLKNKDQESLFERQPLLWAEAKKGEFDFYSMFSQLVLTIGKERTFDRFLPPAYIGVFDARKIVFIPYSSVQEIFYLNDFNWNVTPSNHNSKEFKIIKSKVEIAILEKEYIYDFVLDAKELKFFIKNNIATSSGAGKIFIDKNNFVSIYLRWLQVVKPTIDFNWEKGRTQNILDSDFYLADLFLDDNDTDEIEDDVPITENLFIVFKNGMYEIAKEDLKALFDASIKIVDKNAYKQFWKKYKRPPIEEFQKYIISRRDLLVPQDIRERKGAYFTPSIWVETSQVYLRNTFGNNWQDEFYIWDCASGTGNLLAGLTNKYNVWATTLDQADVNVMHERIDNGANLLKSHVSQFDFLNDEFDKLPGSLKEVISDKDKRKKLIIYINPPYAEADNRKGEGRKNIGVSRIKDKYSKEMGYAKREISLQFLIRIYFELHGCWIAEFSKLKGIQSPSFKKFRTSFKAELTSMFIVPAKTFDNVKGNFPIGFKVWNTGKISDLKQVESDVYDKDGNLEGVNNIWNYDDDLFINDWVKTFRKSNSESIATIIGVGSDFQNQRLVRFGEPHMKVPASNHNWQITKDNLIESVIYYAVRKVIPASWLNDREQFLYPKDSWQTDNIFQSNCLTYTLFTNGFKSSFGTNNWIPFSEEEVNSSERFTSSFMKNYIDGEVIIDKDAQDLFTNSTVITSSKIVFSEVALDVFELGKKIWSYYHSKEGINVNASFYDIREYFQGRNEKGKMNNSSEDVVYTNILNELRINIKKLAQVIEVELYEHKFLK